MSAYQQCSGSTIKPGNKANNKYLVVYAAAPGEKSRNDLLGPMKNC